MQFYGIARYIHFHHIANDDAHFRSSSDNLHVGRRHRKTQTTGFSQHRVTQGIIGPAPGFHVMCKARHKPVELEAAHIDWRKHGREKRESRQD